jgi:hypothetical protein
MGRPVDSFAIVAPSNGSVRLVRSRHCSRRLAICRGRAARISSWLQQHFYGGTFVHRLVAFSRLPERERDIEHLAGIDSAVLDWLCTQRD